MAYPEKFHHVKKLMPLLQKCFDKLMHYITLKTNNLCSCMSWQQKLLVFWLRFWPRKLKHFCNGCLPLPAKNDENDKNDEKWWKWRKMTKMMKNDEKTKMTKNDENDEKWRKWRKMMKMTKNDEKTKMTKNDENDEKWWKMTKMTKMTKNDEK